MAQMPTIALLFAVIFCTQDLLLVHGCVTGVVRLSGGTYSNEGRVEICVDNTWGTVCDNSFDLNDATVVCHQLGYTSAYTYYSSAYYGQGTGPIWLDEVSCTGIEFGLLQCTNSGVGSHYCTHYEDVSVSCYGSSSASCVNGDVRLVGGSNSSSGRVEVCAKNVWGTVCDDYWNDVDASVVCRMLNFTGNAYGYHNAHFGQGTGSILLDNVRCIGTEYSVFSCVHDIIGTNNYNICSHYNDASVVCLSSSCTNGQLRLVNGANQNEGRVEICINNVWGTVCDDGWDISDAFVVCRQLGYSIIDAIAYSNAHFGAGNGSILLDNVNCNGIESSLLSCSHNTIGSNDCSHSEDAGVSCYGEPHTTSDSVGAAVGGTIAGIIFMLGSTICILLTVLIFGISYRRNYLRRQRNRALLIPIVINVSEPNIRVPTGGQGIAGSGGVHYHPVTQVDTEYTATMETLPKYDEIDDDETCILLNQADS